MKTFKRTFLSFLCADIYTEGLKNGLGASGVLKHNKKVVVKQNSSGTWTVWVEEIDPMNAMIKAIRESKEFGKGSCSIIDECFSDAELREALEDGYPTVCPSRTPEGALEWARWYTNLMDE